MRDRQLRRTAGARDEPRRRKSMKRILIVAILALTVTCPAWGRTKLAALPEREATFVRLDNAAATLVEEERVLTLLPGENLVDFSWRGVRIDPDSIRIALLSHPKEVTLLAVSYPPNEEALTWTIHTKKALEERIRISYLLADIDRLVSWKAVADKDETRIDLEAFLVLRNFSGEDFTAATVTIDEGKGFTVPSSHEETRRIPLLSLKGVPITKTFTWDAAHLPWEPKRMDANVGIPVRYVVRNDASSGLGKATLWGGKVRVFQDDGRGGTIFLGEDTVGPTWINEKMEIRIGDSREIQVTQVKTTDRQVNHRPSRTYPALYDTDEEIAVTIESFKEKPIVVDLVEHVPGEWEMDNASLPYERKDIGTMIFHVGVPGKGTTVKYLYHRRNVRTR
jgi:hypothetical protein